jgi:hypothetical protein
MVSDIVKPGHRPDRLRERRVRRHIVDPLAIQDH